MLISLNWLRKYIPDFEAHNIKHLKEKLDTRLSEVEDITVKGDNLANLVVAEIKEVEEHPTNKKLFVCKVDVEQEELLTIVCGAPNAKVGVKSVACLPGGSIVNLSNPEEKVDISERKIGEVVSQGMLCAPDELGLSEDHTSIIELPDYEVVGTDVTSLFRDIVVEIENKAVPHRPDVFSHLGMAREFKTIFKLDLQNPEINEISPSQDTDKFKLDVEIQNEEHGKRLSALIINNITIKPSPLWMQIALSYVGVRPINNVVDVTNYVMMSMGQPLHAFDYHKIAGKKLIIRNAKPKEKLTTLDGKERELTDSMLVVADAENASSIAGIMGGADSEISSETSTIVLEAGNWEMYQVRRTSRALGLRSEASARFEKGSTPESTIPALYAALELIIDIAGGELASELTDVYPNPEAPKKITFNLNDIKRLVGIEIDKAEVIKILEDLGLKITGAEKIDPDSIHIPEVSAEVELLIPSFRRDLHASEDIVEEIARLHGYENIPLTIPERDLKPARIMPMQKLTKDVKKILVNSGFTEIYTYSMVGEQLYSQALLSVKGMIGIPNPISPELAFVRTCLVPSMLTKIKQNLYKFDTLGLFELSRVVDNSGKENGLPLQPHRLAAIVLAHDEMSAYRHIKSAAENLSTLLVGNELKIRSEPKKVPPYFHPGKAGEVKLDGKSIGHIGVIHPLVIENFDLKGSFVAAMEVDFQPIVDYDSPTVKFSPISNYQPVVRDLSFWQAPETNLDQFLEEISEAHINNLQEVEIVDLYFDKVNKTSFTIRVILQSHSHTLDQEEISSAIEKIRNLGGNLNHVIRE